MGANQKACLDVGALARTLQARVERARKVRCQATSHVIANELSEAIAQLAAVERQEVEARRRLAAACNQLPSGERGAVITCGEGCTRCVAPLSTGEVREGHYEAQVLLLQGRCYTLEAEIKYLRASAGVVADTSPLLQQLMRADAS